MEIIVNRNDSFSIFGSVKSEKDYLELKNLMLDKIRDGVTKFELNLKHCHNLNSRILGFFMKLIEKDNITIIVKSKSEEMYLLLKDLALLETFNIKKIE